MALTQSDENNIKQAFLDPNTAARVIALLNAAGSPVTSATYQAWVETLTGYDADADNLGVVRMANGTFECKILDIQ